MTPGEEGIYAARDDDRQRAAISEEIGKAADAMNEMHTRRFTRRLLNQPMTLTYDIVHPGEHEAGLRAYSDTVTVTVDSGDPGGVQDEFTEEMQKFLLQWFDGAAVGIRPANLKPNRYPMAKDGRIVYVSIPED
jgi:hypothetical protein